MGWTLFKQDARRAAEKRPGAFTARIGGHEFPPREAISDAERIARLEDAVRGLLNGIEYTAGGVEAIGSTAERRLGV